MRPAFIASVCLLALIPGALAAPATARGFGASSRGGAGGRVIHVTRLDDDVKSPPAGSFRWAVMQKGPRIVRFAIAGTIELRDRVVVREPRLTIDGGDAPALGVCLKGGSLEFRDTHDIIVRHIRVRLGDGPGLRANRLPLRWRPANSRGLDCINLLECDRVLITHCSLSWSCDEIVSVVRCRGVTVQWCILSEPLKSWRLHPYGNNHAYCLNASASTLSVHHCLFAHYVMRGPQFEANDMRRGDAWDVKMEAANNVMAGFKSSGSRYTTGVEDHREEAAGMRFQFQFIGNLYVGEPGRPAIQASTGHGIHPGVRVGVVGNTQRPIGGGLPYDARAGIETDKKQTITPGHDASGRQMSTRCLFHTSASEEDHRELADFLQNVGCSLKRDAVDARILAGAPFRSQKIIASPHEVGGWPALDGRERRSAPQGITRKLFPR